MSPKAQIEAYAQSIYLIIKNRYIDEIEGADGQVYVSQVIDWTNLFLDELESTTDSEDKLVDWWFARQNAFDLGTVVASANSILVPPAVDRLTADERRYVQIAVGGTVVSNWAVVHPKDIDSRASFGAQDMCAQVGTSLVFSRSFRDTEVGGAITGDVLLRLPRLSATNVKVLTLIRPGLLLKLGVAKNATLPDIVQGVLSPSYSQKFTDLLNGAIARSNASSVAATAVRESYSDVRGVY